MPVVSNLFTGAILSPLLTMLAAVSLATLQRSLDWITHIAKNPQKGYLRELRPYAKNVDIVIERILAGNKFTITTTHILLMAVVILLLTMLLEAGEKPKRMVVVDKKKTGEKSE